jgi:arylsulfatase A-like enzyme
VVRRAALLLPVLWACGAPAPLAPGSPVVLVMVDTLRADHLGSYGYARPTSPEIDRWAERGVLFERAFATAPWTLPSAASLMTGREPLHHGAGRFAQGRGQRRRRVNLALDESVPTLAALLHEHGYASAGFVTNTFLRPNFGLGRGFDTYDSTGHKGSSLRPAGPMVDAALAWIDAQDDAPFLLFLHLMDPHLPYDPPAPARGRFAAQPAGRLSGPIRGLDAVKRAWPPLDTAERAYVAARYDEEIAYVDMQVGRFLDALEQRGVMQRALVVFVADHGEEFWEHGGFEHGHAFHQELLHVPLVFWAPRLRPGRIAAPVSLVDVLPTLLDALGLPAPAGLDGVSLWPALCGGRAPEGREILAQNSLRGPDRRVLVAWPWKLIAGSDDAPPRLFDLASDPGEQTDLAAREPERTREMLARLARLLPAGAGPALGHEVELDAGARRELEALGYLDEQRER